MKNLLVVCILTCGAFAQAGQKDLRLFKALVISGAVPVQSDTELRVVVKGLNCGAYTAAEGLSYFCGGFDALKNTLKFEDKEVTSVLAPAQNLYEAVIAMGIKPEGRAENPSFMANTVSCSQEISKASSDDEASRTACKVIPMDYKSAL